MNEPSSFPKFETDISFEDGAFVDLGLHVSQSTIMQLVHVRDGVIRPLGTCFGITNDGLCMTARHVVDDGLKLIEPGPQHVQLTENHGYIAAMYLSSEPNPDTGGLMGGLLPMHKIYTVNGTDIALVMLNLPTNTETGKRIFFPSQRLRLSPPGVGEMFFGIGYRRMAWTPGALPKNYDVDYKYSATKGEVEELHPGGRDRFMLPHPCFRTSARLDGGMSGGPLVDHAGRVFGVVCSSYGLGEEDEEHISYGSMIAPALAMTVDVRDPDGIERRAFLWDLVEGGAILADQRGVTITKTSDSIIMQLAQGLTLTAKFDG